VDFGRWWECGDIKIYLNFMGVRYEYLKMTEGLNAESYILKCMTHLVQTEETVYMKQNILSHR
jgi:hypothetical protein